MNSRDDLDYLRSIAYSVARESFTEADEIEEVAQNVMAIYLGSPDPVRNPPAWVRQVTRNLVAKEIRYRVKYRATTQQADEGDISDEGHVSEGSSFSEKLAAAVAIEAYLQELSPRQREAIILHHLEGKPRRIVAQLMGVSEETVKTHLARGRKRLAKLISTDGEQDD